MQKQHRSEILVAGPMPSTLEADSGGPMPPEDPRALSLTVVIPTLGRDLLTLKRSIASAQRITREVILVSQANAPDGIATTEGQATTIQVIHDLGRGASRARNLGLASVGTEWVLFLDDDAEILPEFALLATAVPRLGDCWMVAWRVQDDQGRDISRFRDGPARLTAFNHWKLTREHSTLWRTSALRALGGFDESLGPNRWAGAEECSDLMVRLFAAGGTAHYLPICASTHPGSGEIGREKARSYGRGAGWVMRKHLLVPESWPFTLRTIAGLASVLLPQRFHSFPRRVKLARGRGIAEGIVRYPRADHA